jgi:predicted membrane-bound dolichyl-phosphate-mannose-protein mannosyltransferase
MVLDLGAGSVRALVAAAIVMLNPITWFNSAIWGQADSVGSIFLLLGLMELQKDRRESASALAVLAALTKMQLGILGFVVGFVVLRRSLAPKSGEPDPERVLTSLGAGLAMAALICLPFTGLDFAGLAHRLATAPGLATIAVGLLAGVCVFCLGRRFLPVIDAARRTQAAVLLGFGTAVVFAGMVFDSIVTHLVATFGEYPYLTLNAYNPWSLLADHGNAMDTTKAWLQDTPWKDATTGASGSGYVIGPFPTSVVVIVLAAAVLLVVAAIAGRGLVHRLDAPAAETAVSNPEGSVVARTLRAALAEAAGFWGAALVVAVVITAVVVAAMSGIFYAAFLGDGLLLATLLGVGVWAAWRDDAQSLLVALAILSIAFFVEPTRAHERYLFPFFVLGAVLLAVSWRWTVTYVLLSIVNTANLVAVLVQYNGIPSGDGSLATFLNNLGNGVLTATWSDGIIWPIAVCGVVTGLAMIWALMQLRPRAVAALSREVAAAGSVPNPLGWWSQLSGGQSYGAPRLTDALPGLMPPPATWPPAAPIDLVVPVAPGAGSAAAASPAGPVATAVTDATDAPEDEEWIDDYDYEYDPDRPQYVPDWVMNLWHRLARQSTYPDRSPALDSEPRGRLNRLDIWVVAAMVVTLLTMRVYRLDEPLQMHFDEVYHARTATEFLQDWRFGEPHYIYEYTHPHLAKYAIAGGITLFSDYKVVDSGDIGVTVKDALIQPRTAASPLDKSPSPAATANLDQTYGDRVFVATGTEIRVYNLETSALVKTYAIAGAQALSIDGTGEFVYVGTSDGRIYRIDTDPLDDLQNGIATKATVVTELGVDTGLAISHVYAGTDGYVLAADANGKVVSIDLSGATPAIVGRSSIPGIDDFQDFGTGASGLLRTPAGTATATPTTTESATDSATDTSTDTVEPASSEADALASALAMNADDVQAALDSASSPGVPQQLDLGDLTADQISAVQGLITAGTLTDISVQDADPQVLVAYQQGVAVVDARTLAIGTTLQTTSPATSIGIDWSGLDGSGIMAPPDQGGQSSFVAAGKTLVRIDIDQKTTPWTVKLDSQGPIEMPGTVKTVFVDRATRIAHALGRTPDGKGWTIYAIETNGDAVFDDAQLPFQPAAIGLDSSPLLADGNHEQVLAFSPTGSIAAVDVGEFAFSWRIVGVLFGVLMAVCLYLLVRLLFKRRSVALLVALFSMTDGMLFVQSRIAMNDAYVGGFLLLAYLIFAVMWLNVSKRRFVFWVGMPLLGLMLGMALASKWVALYAIASIAMLILIRSALGRLITILGLAVGTGILGWSAIAEMTTEPNTGNPTALLLLIILGLAVFIGGLLRAATMRTTPDKVFIAGASIVIAGGLFGAALTMSPETVQNGAPNYTYFLIMLLATAIAAAANAYHPIAWTREEFRFAVLAPMVLGVVALVVWFLAAHVMSHSYYLYDLLNGFAPSLLKAGVAGIAVGPAVVAVFWLSGKLGFGPLASPPGPHDAAVYAGPPSPAPTGWLRLGSGHGLPAVWMAACLLVLPIAVYVAFYIPWAMPWQPQTAATGSLPAIACWHTDETTGQCVDAWPAGHTGQPLVELTISMYNYHNDLRSPHPASSPWWAWPMDLKPVWFENATYAGDVGTMIYDGGNPALWWLAISAMVFACWQAFKRRSLGLTLIVMAFFWQWLSWSRIDRAAFEYHFYTALPFFLAGLAYLMAELWHGPSKRTWLLARVGGAAALIFPAAAWLLKSPLCELARVEASNNGYKDTICGSTTGDAVLSMRMALIGVVLVLAFAALALILVRLERRQNAGIEDRNWLLQLLLPVGVAAVLLWVIALNASDDPIFQAALPADTLVVVMLPVLAILAFVALTARNPRRFVLGACAFIVTIAVAFYPDWSAFPLPNAIINVYQGLLPTWFYGFEFSVNLQQAAHVALVQRWSILLAAVALLVAGVAGWAAWERRVVIGYRRARLLGGGSSDAEPVSEESAADAEGEASRKDKPGN